MNSKVDRLEKHKKKIKRKAYLNIFLTLVAGFGIGLVLWGPVEEILSLLMGESSTKLIIFVFISLGGMIYMTPLVYYREENEVKSNNGPEYYLERGLENVPLVELVESQGWEEVENTEDNIVLETYPSFLHKAVGRKSTMEIEVVDRSGNQETVVLRSDGSKFEKIKSKVEPVDDGSVIHETGVSLKRYSPAYLELLLFILPQMQDTLKEIAEENLELLDENVEYGLSKFDLNSE